jgi:hypothetical protein
MRLYSNVRIPKATRRGCKTECKAYNNRTIA